MKRVQLQIWTLWWECPECKHGGIVEIDMGEEPPEEIVVSCDICKREFLAVFAAGVDQWSIDANGFVGMIDTKNVLLPTPLLGG